MNVLSLLHDANISYEIQPGHPLSQSRDIEDLTYDSRKAHAGVAFVCLVGANTDGHTYANQAYQNGCRCFFAQHSLDLPPNAAVILTQDTRAALPALSAALFSFPQRQLNIIGITGTKGKTTVASLLFQLLNGAGIPTGLIGTCGIIYGETHLPTQNTTPESYELMRTFSQMLQSGIHTVVMEVSSQALSHHRVDDIPFDLAIFTNLSPDHIGAHEHPDFAHYRDAKKRLFSMCRHALLNADDPAWQDMCADSQASIRTFALDGPADDVACNISPLHGTVFGMGFVYMDRPFTIRLPGKYNVSNALCALSAARYYTHRMDLMQQVLAHATVPGRFETVPSPRKDLTLVIDYAHNAVSMQELLRTVRSYHPKRIVCVFGSVGGRTKQRRAEMGKVVAEYSDFAVITSDNPDFEDPQQIMQDIAAQFSDDLCPHVCIADRREAIYYTLSHAQSGDVILFCGKGHETYQLICGVKEPFRESRVIAQYFQNVQTSAPAPLTRQKTQENG